MILMKIEVFHDYTLQFVNVPLGILKSIYHSLVYPYLYYGNICWGSTYSTRLDSIRKIQKKIIRLIMFAEYKEHTTPLFIRLSMLQLDDINLQVTALFMFRFFNNMLPDSFTDYFMLNRELHHYNTRLSACVHKNYARTNYSKHLLNYRGIDTWNNLPESLKEIKSYYFLKKKKIISTLKYEIVKICTIALIEMNFACLIYTEIIYKKMYRAMQLNKSQRRTLNYGDSPRKA